MVTMHQNILALFGKGALSGHRVTIAGGGGVGNRAVQYGVKCNVHRVVWYAVQ